MLEYVVLEKFKIQAKQELPPDALQAILSNTEVIQQFDYITMNRVLYWQTAFLKGEIVTSYRTEEFAHHILVPANWWQHLKADINKKFGTKFIIKRSPVTENYKHQFPVTATLICPHHGPLEKSQDHFRFLLPTKFPETNNPNAQV